MVDNDGDTHDKRPDTRQSAPNGMSVQVDQAQLDVFLTKYYNLDLPHGSVSSLISHAYMALIAAGVIVHDDGTPITDTSIWMNSGRVWADVNRSSGSGGQKLVWTDTDAAFDPVITTLIDLLVRVLNSPSYDGPLGQPHTRN